MASIQAVFDSENAPPTQGKPQQVPLKPAGPSPRKPLGALQPNAQHASPTKGQTGHQDTSNGNATQKGSLKRSISILDRKNGLSYLKRRKISPTRETAPAPTLTSASDPTLSAALPTISDDPNPLPERPHASTTPPLSSDDDDAKSRQSSQHSFGSLINYDPSSQAGGPTPRNAPHLHRLLSSQQQRSVHRQQIDASRLHAAAVAGRAVAASRAQALRLRLRLAVYKVVTGQTHVVFPRLCVFRTETPGGGGWLGDAQGAGSADEMFGPPIEDVRRRRQSSGEETIVADV